MILLFLITQLGLGSVTNDCQGRVVFRWTNTPSCLVIEGTTAPQDTNSWVRLVGIVRWDGGSDFEYTVDFDTTNSFYRLRQVNNLTCP